jgi:arylsulfatase A-like enzyme
METQVKAGRPFYLQLSHYPGRSAEEALPETRKEMEARFGVRRGRQAAQAVLIADMDKTIGLVLKKLDELGVADRTYVIFSADHGAQDDGANAPLAGGKGSLKEGGVRVPFLVRGPGIKPGTRSPVRGIGWDLLPTLTALAGRTKPLPAEVEGGSLAGVLRGGTEPVRRPREELVTHFPHYDLGNGGPASAIYLGRYKLIRLDETGTSVLFDLETDPSESTDLARMLPEKTAELEARLKSYLTTVKAQLATPNPGYRAERKPD